MSRCTDHKRDIIDACLACLRAASPSLDRRRVERRPTPTNLLGRRFPRGLSDIRPRPSKPRRFVMSQASLLCIKTITNVSDEMYSDALKPSLGSFLSRAVSRLISQRTFALASVVAGTSSAGGGISSIARASIAPHRASGSQRRCSSGRDAGACRKPSPSSPLPASRALPGLGLEPIRGRMHMLHRAAMARFS
jgi:hypothetical protein